MVVRSDPLIVDLVWAAGGLRALLLFRDGLREHAQETPAQGRRVRRVHRAPSEIVEHRRWWLERYTLDEIRELAGAIWPDG